MRPPVEESPNVATHPPDPPLSSSSLPLHSSFDSVRSSIDPTTDVLQQDPALNNDDHLTQQTKLTHEEVFPHASPPSPSESDPIGDVCSPSNQSVSCNVATTVPAAPTCFYDVIGATVKARRRCRFEQHESPHHTSQQSVNASSVPSAPIVPTYSYSPLTHLHKIQFAPILRPTWAEFNDSAKYLQKVANMYSDSYGAVKIIPPAGWRPSFKLDMEGRSCCVNSSQSGNHAASASPNVQPHHSPNNHHTTMMHAAHHSTPTSRSHIPPVQFDARVQKMQLASHQIQGKRIAKFSWASMRKRGTELMRRWTQKASEQEHITESQPDLPNGSPIAISEGSSVSTTAIPSPASVASTAPRSPMEAAELAYWKWLYSGKAETIYASDVEDRADFRALQVVDTNPHQNQPPASSFINRPDFVQVKLEANSLFESQDAMEDITVKLEPMDTTTILPMPTLDLSSSAAVSVESPVVSQPSSSQSPQEDPFRPAPVWACMHESMRKIVLEYGELNKEKRKEVELKRLQVLEQQHRMQQQEKLDGNIQMDETNPSIPEPSIVDSASGCPYCGDSRCVLVEPPSSWDLSNFAWLPGGLLKHLGGSAPGVTDPMLYAGVFHSTFSWHNEDHYLYSISYMHNSASTHASDADRDEISAADNRNSMKVWYTVPGNASYDFERVLQEHVLPNCKSAEVPLALLPKKRTMFSPSILVEKGVPVHKILHEPNTFVVTFCQAYHSGFSEAVGSNVTESVNFALQDWLLDEEGRGSFSSSLLKANTPQQLKLAMVPNASSISPSSASRATSAASSPSASPSKRLSVGPLSTSITPPSTATTATRWNNGCGVKSSSIYRALGSFVVLSHEKFILSIVHAVERLADKHETDAANLLIKQQQVAAAGAAKKKDGGFVFKIQLKKKAYRDMTVDSDLDSPMLLSNSHVLQAKPVNFVAPPPHAFDLDVPFLRRVYAELSSLIEQEKLVRLVLHKGASRVEGVDPMPNERGMVELHDWDTMDEKGVESKRHIRWECLEQGEYTPRVNPADVSVPIPLYQRIFDAETRQKLEPSMEIGCEGMLSFQHQLEPEKSMLKVSFSSESGDASHHTPATDPRPTTATSILTAVHPSISLPTLTNVHCSICKSACYLSYIDCTCPKATPGSVMCLRHRDEVCLCGQAVLTIRYSIKELRANQERLKQFIELREKDEAERLVAKAAAEAEQQLQQVKSEMDVDLDTEMMIQEHPAPVKRKAPVKVKPEPPVFPWKKKSKFHSLDSSVITSGTSVNVPSPLTPQKRPLPDSAPSTDFVVAPHKLTKIYADSSPSNKLPQNEAQEVELPLTPSNSNILTAQSMFLPPAPACSSPTKESEVPSFVQLSKQAGGSSKQSNSSEPPQLFPLSTYIPSAVNRVPIAPRAPQQAAKQQQMPPPASRPPQQQQPQQSMQPLPQSQPQQVPADMQMNGNPASASPMAVTNANADTNVNPPGSYPTSQSTTNLPVDEGNLLLQSLKSLKSKIDYAIAMQTNGMQQAPQSQQATMQPMQHSMQLQNSSYQVPPMAIPFESNSNPTSGYSPDFVDPSGSFPTDDQYNPSSQSRRPSQSQQMQMLPSQVQTPMQQRPSMTMQPPVQSNRMIFNSITNTSNNRSTSSANNAGPLPAVVLPVSPSMREPNGSFDNMPPPPPQLPQHQRTSMTVDGSVHMSAVLLGPPNTQMHFNSLNGNVMNGKYGQMSNMQPMQQQQSQYGSNNPIYNGNNFQSNAGRVSNGGCMNLQQQQQQQQQSQQFVDSQFANNNNFPDNPNWNSMKYLDTYDGSGSVGTGDMSMKMMDTQSHSFDPRSGIPHAKHPMMYSSRQQQQPPKMTSQFDMNQQGNYPSRYGSSQHSNSYNNNMHNWNNNNNNNSVQINSNLNLENAPSAIERYRANAIQIEKLEKFISESKEKLMLLSRQHNVPPPHPPHHSQQQLMNGATSSYPIQSQQLQQQQ